MLLPLILQVAGVCVLICVQAYILRIAVNLASYWTARYASMQLRRSCPELQAGLVEARCPLDLPPGAVTDTYVRPLLSLMRMLLHGILSVSLAAAMSPAGRQHIKIAFPSNYGSAHAQC